MKRLYIVVEGQTEQEFVNELMAPYLQDSGIYSVTPCADTHKQEWTGRHGQLSAFVQHDKDIALLREYRFRSHHLH